MFERFTERARQVIVLAQEASRHGKESSITTKHLLLGLLREEEGLAARSLRDLGIDEKGVLRRKGAAAQEDQPEKLEEQPHGQIPFTEQAKRALELSLREALSYGHNWIGTEHLLLGLARDESSIASVIMSEGWRVKRGDIHNTVAAKLVGSDRPKPEPPQASKGAKDERVIWKYQLHPFSGASVRIPPGSDFLCFAIQDDIPTMWWTVPAKPDGEPDTWPTHEFRVFSTGVVFDANSVKYIGTFTLGGFVGHILEVKRQASKGDERHVGPDDTSGRHFAAAG